MINKITQIKLDSIIVSLQAKLIDSNISYLKTIGNRLSEGYTEYGGLIYLNLNDFKEITLIKDEVLDLLKLDCIVDTSFILIIEKQTKMGMHLDEGLTNQTPRLLASIHAPSKTNIGFVIGNKNFDLSSCKYTVFNPSQSLHDVYNFSDTEDWILLGLNLRDVCLDTEYIVYE
jgi:hypothetical protein